MLINLLRVISLTITTLIISQSYALSFTLEITGNISQFTDKKNHSYIFPHEQLFAMPVHSITTTTSWTPKEKFEGVALADLLAKVGAKGTMMTFYALNDYYINIPISDVEKYHIILAYKMGGRMLKIRNFGPLFLIYPRDSGGNELNSPLYNSRFIWQIKRIEIK
ncbi:molybdopterin-dependent oxidoreductase [Serratia sp. UGAL515B_01]|uniref:molybdopterin-dependent oxidoreductase n=1 Tax=Serratia sp. UGAL515B_01 TaxID=2986763 RepID=UPI00295481EE|nr:molybdopterin-dependent oxidoreductase [Serratia sp. UGAL515B_01]WON77160.1 molybdopterin-dependent oxidoreductase [Serratia sp. UGAL515B_01]